LNTAEGAHPIFSLIDLEHQESDGQIQVMADLAAYKALSPRKVDELQEKMAKRMGKPVKLIMRCVLVQTVSSTGFLDLKTKKSFDGITTQEKFNPDVQMIRQAEQALREAFADDPTVFIFDMDLLELSHQKIIVASVQAHRKFIPYEVGQLEKMVQQRLGNPSIRLVVRCQVPVDVSSEGRILLADPFAPERAGQQQVTDMIREGIENLGTLFARNLNVVWREDRWVVYTEVVGDRAISSSEVREIEKEVSASVGEPVEIKAWSRVELMVTGSENLPLEDFFKSQLTRENL
jgi:hypothetical protein